MTFTKYMHVERLTKDNAEIDGILEGTVYVFPKLDGSNHCVWFDNDTGTIKCASRNHVLTADYDSTKFVHLYMLKHKDDVEQMVMDNKNLVFYGEFMMPHVIRGYENKVWEDWHVFDVFDTDKGRWLTFEEYEPILKKYNITYIHPFEKIVNPDVDTLMSFVNDNHYLMTGDAIGEGIVLKNYDFKNAYGRTTWAKIVREEFKVASKAKPEDRGQDISMESKIVESYLNPDFIEKEYYKYVDENGTWNDKMIPGFIQHVYSEWWKDYSYDVIATLRKPIDMGNLRKCMSKKIVGKVMRIRK